MQAPRAFAGVAIAVAILTPTVAAAGTPLELKDWGGLAAVAISLIALVATQITIRSKTQREKREELKESIEKLLDLRTEFTDKAPTIADDRAREFFASTLNTRKSIYLEWAERLAADLPYVTPAEWIVLGFEHMNDSNFQHAEKIFLNAVKAARQSSTITRSTASRNLAWARMMLGPARWPQARKGYEDIVKSLGAHTDPYSAYTTALTYRTWAEAEFGMGNRAECRARLGDALKACQMMPDAFNYKGFEVRACVGDLMTLAESFLMTADRDATGDCLNAAVDALTAYSDEGAQSLCATVVARRAQLGLQPKPA